MGRGWWWWSRFKEGLRVGSELFLGGGLEVWCVGMTVSGLRGQPVDLSMERVCVCVCVVAALS